MTFQWSSSIYVACCITMPSRLQYLSHRKVLFDVSLHVQHTASRRSERPQCQLISTVSNVMGAGYQGIC